MSTTFENPLTGEPLSDEAAEHVTALRTVRRKAKKDARSGNPAKRMPARNILVGVPMAIEATFRQDADRQGQVFL